MESVSTSDLRRFSEALERLYQPVALATFHEHVFAVVSMVLPEVMMSFDQVSLRTGALRHSRNFEPPDAADWLASLAVNLERDHPGVAYVRGGGSERVLRLEDFLSQRQLRNTALYQENYRNTGIRHQVALVLPIPGYVAGLAINRTSKFAAHEVTLLQLLAPHIVRAHENSALLAALRLPETANASATMPKDFTPREQEVFHWLARGKRDREIATILGSSHRTVQKQVQSILMKLGVETRSAAAALAAGI